MQRWRDLGLEVVVDVVGWLAVLAAVGAIGENTFRSWLGGNFFAELLVLIVIFFVITLAVRIVFSYARAGRPTEPPATPPRPER